MSAAAVTLVMDQGEDWTANVIWTDSYDQPVNVIHPCRMEIKGGDGSTLVTLETDPDIPDGEIPSIAISSEIGLLQLHLTSAVTAAFPPGLYSYDLFVTTDDENTYAGPQISRLIYGSLSVNKRVTEM